MANSRVNPSGGLADAVGSDGKAICSYVRSGQSFVEQHWWVCRLVVQRHVNGDIEWHNHQESQHCKASIHGAG